MTTASNSSIQVQDLRCEYEHNPLGIDVREPRLSWKLVSEQRGVVQSAYQIRVTNEQGEVVWEMGKVLSDQSLHVPYRGPALQSGQRCTWQVRVWDWQARWIEPGW